jgi:predicted PurR-regulated permease PerM
MAVWGIVTGVAGLLIGVAVLVFAVIVFSSLSDSGFFDDLPTSPEEVSEFQSEFQAELGQ